MSALSKSMLMEPLLGIHDPLSDLLSKEISPIIVKYTFPAAVAKILNEKSAEISDIKVKVLKLSQEDQTPTILLQIQILFNQMISKREFYQDVFNKSLQSIPIVQL